MTAVRVRSRADVGRDPLALGRIAQRLRLQPQRGQWRSHPVREVRDRLAFFGDQLIDPVGELVERWPDFSHLTRPVGRGPSGDVPGGEQVRGLGRLDKGPNDATSQQLGAEHADHHQPGAAADDQRQPAPDSGVQGSIRHVDLHEVRAVAAAAGDSATLPPRASASDVVPSERRRHPLRRPARRRRVVLWLAAVRGPGPARGGAVPSTVPSGVRTLVRRSLFCASAFR